MSLLKRIEKGGKGDGPSRGEGGSGGGDQRPKQPGRTRVIEAGGAKPASGYQDLKSRVQNKLLAEMNKDTDTSSKEEIRRHIEELFNAILAEESMVLSRNERVRLFEAIVDDIIGFGPIEPLLRDESVSEIMVNGPKMIYVERKGMLSRTNITFESDEHVLRIIDRIVAPLGRRVDESSPLVDARLPDGSRVNVVIRPLALNGPTITIRKFERDPLGVQDLVRFGSMTAEIADFLKACVVGRLNTVVSGGTGSGKTTLLNVLSSFIPNDERIITVENAAELQLQQDHVVTLESRPANIEGKGKIDIQDLVVNCLRMRPDRIIVGECRAGEALDMLQAMNTGHDGSLTTLHANTPRDAVSRLEVMCLMAGMDLPTRAIREQIAAAVDVICQQARLRDGSRKITYITEVQGMEGEMITMSDIFEFEQTGFEGGKIVGRIRPTGIRPKFIDRIEDAGIHLPPSTFGIGARR
ncbi:MAG: CpaF family protein [Chloroflexota bacterium]